MTITNKLLELLIKTYRKLARIINEFKMDQRHFSRAKDNKNTAHPSFNFISNNKDYILGFSLKLVDPSKKIIRFVEGEKNSQFLSLFLKY